VKIPRTTVTPVIDGDIDDSAWQNAARAQLDYINTGAPAGIQTSFYLTYDDSRIYIAFRCMEPEIDKIKAGTSKRDGPVFYDDSVEVFMRPSEATKNYYHLAANTEGVQYDSRISYTTWDSCWQSVFKIMPDFWTVEIAIPFANLGCGTPAKGDIWGFNLARNRTISGEIETFVWSVPYGTLHTPGRFGRIVFE